MKLSDYFENTNGTGVLATADKDGNVNAAVYARPHSLDEDTVAFIMANRLSHENLKTNPKAAYLFIESGAGYKGKRLYLAKKSERNDQDQINELRRKRYGHCLEDEDCPAYLVYFTVEKLIPLVGSGK